MECFCCGSDDATVDHYQYYGESLCYCCLDDADELRGIPLRELGSNK